MTSFNHTFQARGNQAKIRYDKSPAILLSGPMGTGKSRTCLEKLHLVCLLRPDVKCLITRKTFKSIRNSVLDTYLRYVAKPWIDTKQVTIYGGSVPSQIQYRNGSTIDIVGLDNPGRINSTEYDIIYVAEAVELDLEDWTTLNGRARASALSYNQLLADTNPAHEEHWLYQEVQNGKVKFYDTYHEDNPKWFDDDGNVTEEGRKYIARLDNMTGVWYQRYRLGRWISAEGAVYDNFERAFHVIDRFDIPVHWRRYWSIDWGWSNPLVLQCWAEDGDGRLYLYREFYRTHLKTVVAAGQIMSIVAPDGQWIEPKPTAVITDHDPEAMAVFSTETGLTTTPARKDVDQGVQKVHSRFQKQGDGRARIYIFRDALAHAEDSTLKRDGKPTSTVAEIPGYRWNAEKDVPVKENDHGCDAMRYMVAYKDLRVPLAMV